MNRECFLDTNLTGRIYHPRNLIFENGVLKQFKINHTVIGGQKVIIIGSLEKYQLCLNITSSTLPYIKELKDNGQIFELSIRQAQEIYKKPKVNTVVRLDNIHIFKDVYGFENVSFDKELFDAFMKVESSAFYNPMNLSDVNDLIKLPLHIIKQFHPTAKEKLLKQFDIEYSDLINKNKEAAS